MCRTCKPGNITNTLTDFSVTSRTAFKKSFELLSGGTGTGCQSFVIFITDGQDTDGDQVRCEKGYYTRSGYVPGKKCQYNWDTVWDNVKIWNTRGVSVWVIILNYSQAYGEWLRQLAVACFLSPKCQCFFLIDKDIFVSSG